MIAIILFFVLGYLLLVPMLFLKHRAFIASSFNLKMITVSVVGMLFGSIPFFTTIPARGNEIFILLETLFLIIIFSSIKVHVKNKVSTKRTASLIPRAQGIHSSLFRFSLIAALLCSVGSLICYPIVIESGSYDIIVHIKSLYLLFITGLFFLMGRKNSIRVQNFYGVFLMLSCLLILLQIFKTTLAVDSIGRIFIVSIFIIGAFFYNAYFPEKKEI